MEIVRGPVNEQIIEFLRRQAVPKTDANSSPWDVDECELHVHPDLRDRLLQIAALAGVEYEERAAFGVVTLVDPNGTVFACVRGTSDLLVRVGADLPGKRTPDLGSEWIEVDAWLSDLPSHDGSLKLAYLLEAAQTNCSAEMDPPSKVHRTFDGY